MLTLTGIFSQSFGGTCTIRGYAKYTDIVDVSYPHPDYQRPEDEKHIEDISKFIISGTNTFTPEVVLAYTAEYDYYADGASSDVDAIKDIKEGNGFTSNINKVSFKKIKAVPEGFLYEIKIPDNKKVLRRVDGNHRLCAFEKLIAEGQAKEYYLIPFCIIIFQDNISLKDEKIIFHNINSKAIPIKSELLLKNVIVEKNDALDFNDEELKVDFGNEYLFARYLIKNQPLMIRKLKRITWVKHNLLSVLVDLIRYVDAKSPICNQICEGAFVLGLNSALSHAERVGENELAISSGLLYLLTLVCYEKELDETTTGQEKEEYRDRLITWSRKYRIAEAQNDSVKTATINADCIKDIFDKYRRSEDQTIFLSRCFSSEYDENEHAIQRVIDNINREKKTSLKLTRVDRHTEGETGQISDRVFKGIDDAGLIIADLSSGRPNIPHEIGYAMGVKKSLILIHNGTDEQAEAHTPSNIKMYEQIRFNGNYHYLEEELKKHLIDYYKF